MVLEFFFRFENTCRNSKVNLIFINLNIYKSDATFNIKSTCK